MDYVVEAVPLTPEVERHVLALATIGFETSYPPDRITTHTVSEGRAPPLCVVARIGDNIIGFNAFMAHSLPFDGGILEAYQSCWTVTDPAHRGKKIFQNIVNGAREILRARGAAFIFGYPNEVSRPLFTHKLGFREVPCLTWSSLGPMRLAARRLDRTAALGTAVAVGQDDRALIDLKRRTYGDALEVVENGEDFLWGVYRNMARRKLALRFFDIGGISATSPEAVAQLLSRAASQLKTVASVRLMSTQGNGYNPAFPGFKPEQVPLILDDLNVETAGLQFNFFGGVRDYY